MPPPQLMRIELTPEAKHRLEGVAEKMGMTQLAVMSRLAEWFKTESELLQSAVLGRFPDSIEPDVAKLILKKLGEGERTAGAKKTRKK